MLVVKCLNYNSGTCNMQRNIFVSLSHNGAVLEAPTTLFTKKYARASGKHTQKRVQRGASTDNGRKSYVDFLMLLSFWRTRYLYVISFSPCQAMSQLSFAPLYVSNGHLSWAWHQNKSKTPPSATSPNNRLHIISEPFSKQPINQINPLENEV